MPGLDGLETCERIRQFSMVPVIMLTALGRQEDVVAGLKAGADDYCAKPMPLTCPGAGCSGYGTQTSPAAAAARRA